MVEMFLTTAPREQGLEREMEKFEYTDGSEKQNAWAGKIAAEWIGQFDREIENQKMRPESDGMTKYIEILEENRKKLVAGFQKITAKGLIDLYVAKRNPINAMIDQSTKEYKGLQK